MDCNWCAVCSKHFHSDTQASLYCSEDCRKADALACCEFHGCSHPDSTAHHDHLTFCHHHRPAIRIPSLPLNLNPKPSLEQMTYGQYQNNEWSRFLQQQYNHHNHTSSVASHLSSSRNPYFNSCDSKFTQSTMPFLTASSMFPSQTPSVVCEGANRSGSMYNGDGAKAESQIPLKHQTFRRQSAPPHAPILNTANPASLTDRSGSSFKSCTSMSILELSSGDHECEQPCVRKNKVLPPPTLSPMLPATISNPASLNLTGQPPQRPERRAASTAVSKTSRRRSSSSSSFSSTMTSSDHEDDDTDIAHAWPTMDRFFFPDHCCRTSACGQKKKEPQSNNKESRRQSVSELPPPPAKRSSSVNPFLALSASIWGNGWHQVEPLPASFVKTIQRSNLAGYGCEREGRSHRHRARHQNNNHHQTGGQHCQHNFAKNGYESHARAKQGNHRNNSNCTKATNADASSWATVCSNRLPRSLQFID